MKERRENKKLTSTPSDIKTKQCSKCNKEKAIDEYNKDPVSSDGFRVWCNSCLREIEHYYYNKYKENPASVPNTKPCGVCKIDKPGTEFSRSRSSRDGLTYICKKCAQTIAKRDRIKIREHQKNRLKTDECFRVLTNIRRRVKLAIKANPKKERTIKLLGVSAKEYVNYLKDLFWPGMTWENYGKDGWVIDHIVPVSSFNQSDLDWQNKAFNYKNTQPLWKDDNARKAARLDWSPSESKHELPETLRPLGNKT